MHGCGYMHECGYVHGVLGCGYEYTLARVLDKELYRQGMEHLVYYVCIFVFMCCASVHVVCDVFIHSTVIPSNSILNPCMITLHKLSNLGIIPQQSDFNHPVG